MAFFTKLRRGGHRHIITGKIVIEADGSAATELVLLEWKGGKMGPVK